MVESSSGVVKNITAEIRKEFGSNNIQWNSDQLHALKYIKEFTQSTKVWMALVGAAGTGKTTLLKEAIKSMRKVAISAPTHKAKLVAALATGVSNSFTVAEILGLNPDVDIADFDPQNPAFKQKREPKIKDYPYHIIDEGSMVNKELHAKIIECAEEYNVQVIFVGDLCQLPPVKESENSLALTGENVVELHKIIRQSNENPLTYLLAVIRYLQEIYQNPRFDTKERFEEVYEIICRYTDDYSYDELYTVHKNLFFYLIKKGTHITDGKGFTVINELDKFYSKAAKGISDGGRVLAFTNACIATSNQEIRKILGYTNQLEPGELVTGYKTLRDDKNNMFLTNSLDYKILNRSSKISYNDIDMIRIELEDLHFHSKTYVDLIHPSMYDKFKNLYDQYQSNGKTKGEWPKFFQFKDAHALMSFNNKQTIDYKGKKRYEIKNDLEYGYGLTIHKSQGSTYKYVYVRVDDIYNTIFKYPEDQYDKDKIMLALKLLYVALSRATDVAVIKF